MNIEIKVDTSKFDKLLADVPAALARAQSQALKDIGQAVASRTTLAFRHQQMRPSPWAPRKKSKRDDGHPLLIKSGALRQSIGWKLQGSDTVVIGTDRKYAGYHQTGTKNMPARPFFPVDRSGNLTPQMKSKIDGIVEKTFAEELRKTIGGMK